MKNPLPRHAKELASLWCGVHPVPEREQAFRELFNLPDAVSPLGLAIRLFRDAFLA